MRDAVSHRTIARSEAEKLGGAKFKVGDVVTTKAKVKCLDGRGKQDGYALPGWKWRIVKIEVVYSTAAAMSLAYRCVAHDTPLFYKCTLKEISISQVVGKHAGELLGKKS